MVNHPARIPTPRTRRIISAGLLVVIAALATGCGYRLLAASSATPLSPGDVPRSASFQSQQAPQRGASAAASIEGPRSEFPRPQRAPQRAADAAASPPDIPRAERGGLPGAADGVVPDGTTVFDDEVPGIANLDPALLGAVRQAAADAADDGVAFFVDSGWRSPAYQEQLLREAILAYGSEAEAARWVATPTTSAHVAGDAVDIGPVTATEWLSEHGAMYGLCQTYHNEPWHYELRPAAVEDGCPPMYADPTHDPRMQQ